MAGTCGWARLPPSGGEAVSSAPSSWTASAMPMPAVASEAERLPLTAHPSCLAPVEQGVQAIRVVAAHGDAVDDGDRRQEEAQGMELGQGLGVADDVLEHVGHASFGKKLFHRAAGA